MNRYTYLAIMLCVAFAMPHPASAAVAYPAEKHHAHKAINSSRPGSPGYTNSSPLGSAEKADKRAKKKAAKEAKLRARQQPTQTQ